MGNTEQIRQLIAQEAARLMYEEGVREYRDAKRKAAHRYSSGKGPVLGACLPSNAEIHRELQRLLRLYEPEVGPQRLLELRLLALKYMTLLEPFRPYLVGSVLSGVVSSRSDVDLHLFAESEEEVEDYLRSRGLSFEAELVTVRKGSEFKDYPHLYLQEDGVEIECSVYPPEERHLVSKSSITGKPMARADLKKLRGLIAEQLDA
jgi:hypothetical protein